VKHIKTKKIFESQNNESIIDDIRIILEDILDMGYYLSTDSVSSPDHLVLLINKSRLKIGDHIFLTWGNFDNPSGFNIEESMLHLEGYMSEYGGGIKIRSSSSFISDPFLTPTQLIERSKDIRVREKWYRNLEIILFKK